MLCGVYVDDILLGANSNAHFWISCLELSFFIRLVFHKGLESCRMMFIFSLLVLESLLSLSLFELLGRSMIDPKEVLWKRS